MVETFTQTIRKSDAFLNVKHYILRHDEDLTFAITYLSLSVAISFLFSLGVFVLLVVAHIIMDIIKHTINGASFPRALARGCRDCIIDFAFLFLGFVFSIYFEYALALGVTRGLLQIRYLRAFQVLPKIAIFNRFSDNIAKFFITIKKQHYFIAFDGHFTIFEKVFVGVLIMSIVLVALSPVLIGLTGQDLANIFKEEFSLRVTI